jgi:hypothetical protein
VLRGRTTGRRDVGWLGSGNLAVRRTVFEAIGGFDERLETCEDVDLCERIRAAGHRLVADERLHSIHLGDPATLTELFISERWRGRDNLRVSLRSGFSPGHLPSVVLPILTAASVVTLAAAALTAPLLRERAFLPAAIALGALGGVALVRTARMVSSGGLPGPATLPAAFLVALTYEAGRGCSLILPAGHRRRRAARDVEAPAGGGM